jgi:hypothetical protein
MPKPPTPFLGSTIPEIAGGSLELIVAAPDLVANFPSDQAVAYMKIV